MMHAPSELTDNGFMDVTANLSPQEVSSTNEEKRHEDGNKHKKRGFQLQSKTILIALVLCFLVSVIVLIVMVIYAVSLMKSEQKELCTTNECLRSAANLAQSMDPTADPCHDFYQYSCGNWAKQHPQYNVHNTYDWFKHKQLSVYKEVRQFLGKTTSNQAKPVKQVKDMYAACTNTRLLNEKGLSPLLDIFKSVGLPSYPTFFNKDKSVSHGFDWIRAVSLIKTRIGIDVLIGFEICSEPKNSSVNRLVLESPETKNPFVSELHIVKGARKQRTLNPLQYTRGDITKDTPLVNKKPKREVNKGDHVNKINSFYADIMRKYIWGVNIDIENVYEKTKLAAEEYQRVNDHILSLEAAKEDENAPMIPANFPEYTVDDLQSHTDKVVRQNNATTYPIWRKYLLEIFNGSDVKLNFDSDKILIFDSDLKYLSDMAAYVAKTPPVILELYLWFKVLEVVGPQTTSEVRLVFQQVYDASNYKMSEIGVLPRSLQCAITIYDMMDMAVAYGLVDTEALDNTRPRVHDMLNKLKHALSDLILSTSWMDEDTKNASYKKIQDMAMHIGFPEFLLKESGIKEYYEGLQISDENHLQNMLNVAEFKVKKSVNSLRFKNKLTWEKNPLEVNAFHTFEENTITVPIVLMQYPFFDLGLDSLNFGALGSVLGHELTHGFDNLGCNFDKNGNLLPWWPNRTRESFENLTRCFQQQYSSYHLALVNENVDGDKTLGENIADNGGLREAFLAFQHHQLQAEPEPKLPGFSSFTAQQMFFLSFGNLWCSVYTPESLREELEDVHSPLSIRVFGALQNNEDFSHVFNCPLGSNMNPRKKCVIY